MPNRLERTDRDLDLRAIVLFHQTNNVDLDRFHVGDSRQCSLLGLQLFYALIAVKED